MNEEPEVPWEVKGACLLLIACPLVRLVEACLRLHFMGDYYGSFWDALLKDLMFSEGWRSYVTTPLGMTFTILPVAMVGIALLLFWRAVVR